MKITATIQAIIKVDESTPPDEAHEEVVERLADICDQWLNGDLSPRIKIQYMLDDSYTPPKKDKYLN